MLIKHAKEHAYCVNHVRTEVEVDEVTDWPDGVAQTAIDRYGAERVVDSIHDPSDDSSHSDSEDTGDGSSDDNSSDSTSSGGDSSEGTTEKETPVDQFSKSTMKAINKSGKSIEELKAMSREDMIALPGIGEKSADEILNG